MQGDGALLINKHPGISSFGIIEALQRELAQARGLKRKSLPKLGHGGTLDPFATGLLVVCVGRGVKLARYFLGSTKHYAGQFRFGETTVAGDPTEPVSESSERVPSGREEIAEIAHRLTLQPYLQTPPMHSAKKRDGRPLYELARQGIEVEREAKLCHLRSFEILSFEGGPRPTAAFSLTCSSGTYVRTLAQDLGRLLGSVAMLDRLERTGSGPFRVERAWTVEQLGEATRAGTAWDELSCWVPFHRLLEGLDRAQATHEEAQALFRGQQGVLFNILRRVEARASRVTEWTPGADRALLNPETPEPSRPEVAIYSAERLVAVASRQDGTWGLDRVFPS